MMWRTELVFPRPVGTPFVPWLWGTLVLQSPVKMPPPSNDPRTDKMIRRVIVVVRTAVILFHELLVHCSVKVG